MKLAIVAAGFSPEKANKLRRAMATFRNVGTIHTLEADMVEGMVGRGYKRDFAQRCFQQIRGFGSYGFPESHAAAFSQLGASSQSWQIPQSSGQLEESSRRSQTASPHDAGPGGMREGPMS